MMRHQLGNKKIISDEKHKGDITSAVLVGNNPFSF